MSKPPADGVFLYLAIYDSADAAQGDYAVVKDLHSAHAIGVFDAAVITKDDKGKVHINKDETSTRAGGWGGVAVGAVIGILFPPSIIGAAAVTGVVGAVAGHLWGGMSRSDVKELGELMDEGDSALLVIGDITISEALQKAELHAVKQVRKEINADLKDVEKEIKKG